MARVPRLVDVSVPLVARSPAYPGNTDFAFQFITRATGGGISGAHRAAPRLVLKR